MAWQRGNWQAMGLILPSTIVDPQNWMVYGLTVGPQSRLRDRMAAETVRAALASFTGNVVQRIVASSSQVVEIDGLRAWTGIRNTAAYDAFIVLQAAEPTLNATEYRQRLRLIGMPAIDECLRLAMTPEAHAELPPNAVETSYDWTASNHFEALEGVVEGRGRSEHRRLGAIVVAALWS